MDVIAVNCCVWLAITRAFLLRLMFAVHTLAGCGAWSDGLAVPAACVPFKKTRKAIKGEMTSVISPQWLCDYAQGFSVGEGRFLGWL